MGGLGLVGLLVTDDLSDFRFVFCGFDLVLFGWCVCAVRFELVGCG